MSRKVVLHVGTPKTGTSYVQDVLFRNQRTLLRHGILYPADRHDAQFLAGLDLMRMPWGGLEKEAVGAWDALAERVRGHDGTAIVSHEILATASRSQVGRALASLGDPADTEVHLVLSVRDLVRQIPAEWQENVKHRAGLSYASFLEQIRDPDRSSRIASWFWGVQEVPEILQRWAHDLPPERVHLVTVPPPGGAPELLWKRFSQALDLDGIDLDHDGGRANPSLGAPETALIRRINRSANRDLPPAHYRPLVRELLAHQTLSQRRSSPRLGLPPDHYPWVAEVERTWVDAVRDRGYDVVGDLGELLGPAPESWSDPDRPAERQVASAAVDAIKALLLDNARLRDSESRLQAELDETRRALERSYLRPTYRLRREDRAPAPDERRRPDPAPRLPGGAGQELAVGVAPHPPGGVGVGAHAHDPAEQRHLLAGERRCPLPGDALQHVGGHLGGDQGVEARVVHRRGGDRHRRGGQLALAHQLLHLVLAQDRHQDRVAHPRVGEVVAAQVRDARHQPALQHRDARDVGGHGHRHRQQAAEVGGEALDAGPAHVVLDHLVHRALHVATLLGELLLGGRGGRRQGSDSGDGPSEGLAHERGRQPGRRLRELRREHRRQAGAQLLDGGARDGHDQIVVSGP